MLPQITLYLQNAPGQMAAALAALSDAKVNVQAFMIDEDQPFSRVRIVCDDHKAAVDKLRARMFSFDVADVLAVELPHRPGALHEVMALFGNAGINIDYGYLTLIPDSREAVVLLKTSDEDAEPARKLLQENGYNERRDIPQVANSE